MKTVKWSILIFLPVLIFCSSNTTKKAFLETPKVISNVTDYYLESNRTFQGIPSIEVAENGRMWATWYAGPTAAEDSNNYVVVMTSGDGENWQISHIVDPDVSGPVRVFDPELWIDPTGKLWAFWAQAIGHDGTIGGVWAMTTENPGEAKPNWSAPQRLTDGVMMCKPTVLGSGEWVLPASTWRKADNSARVVVSTDKGETWTVRGGCNVPEKVRSFDEHMIIEKTDGSLWLLARTRYGIGESVSTDKGETWPELTPSSIQHPAARFFIRRLDSGKLLLVKHGPLDEQTGRSHLTAYLSDDDGASWYGGLLLDERESISYPDGKQAADGTIHIIYDFSRKDQMEIMMASFTEADVAAGKLISKYSKLKKIVNKAG